MKKKCRTQESTQVQYPEQKMLRMSQSGLMGTYHSHMNSPSDILPNNSILRNPNLSLRSCIHALAPPPIAMGSIGLAKSTRCKRDRIDAVSRWIAMSSASVIRLYVISKRYSLSARNTGERCITDVDHRGDDFPNFAAEFILNKQKVVSTIVQTTNQL